MDDDPGNPLVDFRGERRRNETHAGITDPEARLLRKGPGKEAKMAFLGHALMENRHGQPVDFTVSPATGTAERDAVPELLDGVRERGCRPRTLGADLGYDTKDCVKAMRARRAPPHVAQMKTVGGLRCTRDRGLARTGLASYLVTTAYHLVRVANQMVAPEAEPVPPG